MLSLCFVIKRSMRVTPLGFCLRVIVIEKLQNLDMTTSSVLSVIESMVFLLSQYTFLGCFGLEKCLREFDLLDIEPGSKLYELGLRLDINV